MRGEEPNKAIHRAIMFIVLCVFFLSLMAVVGITGISVLLFFL